MVVTRKKEIGSGKCGGEIRDFFGRGQVVYTGVGHGGFYRSGKKSALYFEQKPMTKRLFNRKGRKGLRKGRRGMVRLLRRTSSQ